MNTRNALFDLCGFDFPDNELIPGEFADLLKIGKGEWNVEVFGKKWKFVKLEDWEIRENMRKLSNYDIVTKAYLQRTEILNRVIMEFTDIKSGNIYTFESADEKAILRHILLLLDPLVLGELYEAYNIGAEYYEEQFKKKFPDIRKRMTKDFFGSQPESLGRSGSKIQKTPDSTKSSTIEHTSNGSTETSLKTKKKNGIK